MPLFNSDLTFPLVLVLLLVYIRELLILLYLALLIRPPL